MTAKGHFSMAGQGAGNIAKRSTNIDFGMGQNEGVFNPGRATGNILSDATYACIGCRRPEC